jgi:hypothetical protein
MEMILRFKVDGWKFIKPTPQFHHPLNVPYASIVDEPQLS